MGLVSKLEEDRLVRPRGGLAPNINDLAQLLLQTANPLNMVQSALTGQGKKKRSKKTIKGGVETKESIRTYLKKNKLGSDEEIDDFIDNAKKPPGWHTSQKRGKEAFEEWVGTKRASSERKEPEEEKYHTPPASPAKSVASQTSDSPSIKPKRGTFKLNSKEFDMIKNTMPKLEYRKILKDFFKELSVQTFNELPGDFVGRINNLSLHSGSSSKSIEELRGVLDSFKVTLSKRTEPQPTTVKLKVEKAPPKKTRSKKVKSLIAIKKTKIKKLPQPDKIPKKSKGRKKAKKSKPKKVKGGEDTTVSDMVIAE